MLKINIDIEKFILIEVNQIYHEFFYDLRNILRKKKNSIFIRLINLILLIFILTVI
jgi:hypothetical protein